MQVKKFEATSLAEALRDVKQALGNEAVILSTRNITVPQPGKAKPQTRIEVYAASDTGGVVAERPAPPSTESEKAEASWVGELRREIRDLRNAIRSVSAGLGSTVELDMTDSLQHEIEYLGNLMESVSRESNLLRSIGLPRGLRTSYQRLVHHGVRPDLVLARVEELIQEGAPSEAPGTRLPQRLMKKLRDAIKVSGPILEKNWKKGCGNKKAALVGPTGVGKTTTVAKLAANYAMSRGLKVGMVTIDTYRVAAVDQLHAYAEIMSIPLQVVLTPAEFSQSLRKFSDRDLILIDTAGRNHRDPEQMAQLKMFFREIPDLEVHLVLSSSTSEGDLFEALRLYDPLPFHRMIITKVDETCFLGSLYNLVAATDCPISYITNGQRVPEDIELATVSRVADLALPQE